MKKFYTLFVILAIYASVNAQAQLTFHDYAAVTITGDTISLAKYYGKKVMVVNTASYCQYTPEFKQLEQLYEQYAQYHFTIIGFPCNDFGSQDPGSDSTINAFCTGIYDVSFQMMSKIATISHDTAPVYKWLEHKSLNGVADAAISWNFNKFLIDESGHWVRHVESAVSPLDTSIINWIKSPSTTPGDTIVTRVVRFVKTKSYFNPPATEEVRDYSLSGVAQPAKYGITTGVNDITSTDDELIKLNSSNPSNSYIGLSISSSQKVLVRLYSVEGRIIATLFEGRTEGEQTVNYPITGLPGGIYLINAQSTGQQKTIKYLIER